MSLVMELTKEEAEQIKKQRAETELLNKKKRFRIVIFKLCHEWCIWHEEEGLYLTFSVFIDNFKVRDRIPEEFSDNIQLIYNSMKVCLESMNERLDQSGFHF